MIYNDGYAVFAADRHPQLLGSKVLEGWPEAADLNRRVLDECLAGRTLTYTDLPLTLYRNKGKPENLWTDLSYQPVIGDDGQPAGVLAIVIETTTRVLAQKALADERRSVIEANKRLSAESAFLRELFEQTPSFMAMASGPAHVFVLTNHAYQELIGGRHVIGLTVAEALPEVVDQGFVELLDTVYQTGEAHIGRGSRVMLAREGDPEPREHFIDFIYQPLRNANGEVIGIFIEGQDVTDRHRGEEHLRLVVNELNHRVKNTLATIQGVAAQTFRNADNVAQAQANFSARIMAIARANDLLTGENWEGASVVGHRCRSVGRMGRQRTWPLRRPRTRRAAIAKVRHGPLDGDARTRHQRGEIRRTVDPVGNGAGELEHRGRSRRRAHADRVARKRRSACRRAVAARLRQPPCAARPRRRTWRHGGPAIRTFRRRLRN